MRILNDCLISYKDKYYCIVTKELTEYLGLKFLKQNAIGCELEQSAYLVYDDNGIIYKSRTGKITCK